MALLRYVNLHCCDMAGQSGQMLFVCSHMFVYVCESVLLHVTELLCTSRSAFTCQSEGQLIWSDEPLLLSRQQMAMRCEVGMGANIANPEVFKNSNTYTI